MKIADMPPIKQGEMKVVCTGHFLRRRVVVFQHQGSSIKMVIVNPRNGDISEYDLDP